MEVSILFIRSFIKAFHFLYSYEERNRSLDSVSSRYKESTTFEDFASRIYNPIQPLSPMGTLRESNASSAGAPLASALIDHNRASVKGKCNKKVFAHQSTQRDNLI